MFVLKNEIILKEEDHTYWTTQGVPRREPGVTEILKHFGFIYYPKGIEFQMERGKEVHRCIELLEKNKLDVFSVDPAIQPYLSSFERLRDKMKWRLKYAETCVWNDSRRFCGTLDALWIIKGEEIIADYKTSETISSWVKMQLGGYDAAIDDDIPRRRCAVQLMADGSVAQVHWFNDGPEKALFKGLASNFHWKIQHKMIRD